jgi:HSP20 family protein
MAQKLFADFEHLHQQMDEMWERLTGGQGSRPRFCPPILEPPVDIYETTEDVVILAEIAGIGDEDVQIDLLGDRHLRFHGQKDDHHAAPGHRHSQMEICYGTFERTVNLPAEVDPEGIQASYRDGFLKIVLPKRQEQTRQVRVTIRPQTA